MAIVVPRELITDSEALTLRKTLFVAPVSKPIYRRGRSFTPSTSDKGVQAYVYEEDPITCRKYMRLPLRFGICYTKSNNDKLPYITSKFSFSGKLREEQLSPVNEVIKYLNQNRTAVLNARMGFGKTTMSIAVSSRVGLLTVILVHETGMIGQWAQSYTDRSTAKIWRVKEERQPSSFDVLICYKSRYVHIPKDVRDRIGLLIVDECHCFCNKTGMHSILGFQPKYVLMLTATFEKESGMHKLLELVAGTEKVVCWKPFNINVIRCNSGVVGERVRNSQGIVDWHVLNKSIIYNEIHNRIVIQLGLWFVQQGLNPLIITNEVEHVILLYELFKKVGMDSCDYVCGNKGDFKDSDILIGNFQKCGTGMDEESRCIDFKGRRRDTVIVAGTFKDIIALRQVIGRCCRVDNISVILIVANDPTIQRHYNKWKDWCLTQKSTFSVFEPSRLPPLSTFTPSSAASSSTSQTHSFSKNDSPDDSVIMIDIPFTSSHSN